MYHIIQFLKHSAILSPYLNKMETITTAIVQNRFDLMTATDETVK
jgi:hypothetical protein